MVQDLFYRDHRKPTSNQNEEAAMKRQADRQIRSLIDAGLLQCGMVWYEAISGFPYPYRYLELTELGARVLEDTTGQPVRFRSHRKDKGQEAARHTLAINQFYVALQRGCWARNCDLSLWLDDRQLAALDQSTTKLENIPDAFVLLESVDRMVPLFLEADRGTETLVSASGRQTDLLTKFSRYRQHFTTRFHQAPYFADLPAPVLLTVTTAGAGRCANLLETARQAECDDAFWFTTATQLYATKLPTAVWNPVWQTTNDVSYRSLMNLL